MKPWSGTNNLVKYEATSYNNEGFLKIGSKSRAGGLHEIIP